MGLERTIEHLKEFNAHERIILLDESLATVSLAAQGLGVEPDRIAKSLGFRTNEGPILIVVSGEARIDNRKFKDQYHQKAKMLSAQETSEYLRMPIGGVCPFGLPEEIPVYLDISLKKYDTVFPSCGAINSAIEVTPEEIELFSRAESWVDVTKDMK